MASGPENFSQPGESQQPGYRKRSRESQRRARPPRFHMPETLRVEAMYLAERLTPYGVTLTDDREVFTPEEIRTLLEKAPRDFIPRLVIRAFAACARRRPGGSTGRKSILHTAWLVSSPCRKPARDFVPSTRAGQRWAFPSSTMLRMSHRSTPAFPLNSLPSRCRSERVAARGPPSLRLRDGDIHPTSPPSRSRHSGWRRDRGP